MEILLNELSIDGQFTSEEEFTFYLKEKLINVLQLIEENGFFLLKKSDVYDRKITPDKTLMDILTQYNFPLITALKSYISQLCAQEPYWDDAIMTDAEAEYCYSEKQDEPNAFTEAIERNVPLLSLAHNKYSEASYLCSKNDKKVEIANIQKIEDLLKVCIDYQALAIDYIIEQYPYDLEVSMVRLNDKCHAKEALESNELTTKDYQNILEDLGHMMTGLKLGQKNRYWDSIDDGLFEFRANVSAGRIFRLFFIQKKGIQLLNGFIKKTEQTPLHEIKKAKKIVSELKKR